MPTRTLLCRSASGQTISQPYVRTFVELAARAPCLDMVLEIGGGCGYQAAVLGAPCA